MKSVASSKLEEPTTNIKIVPSSVGPKLRYFIIYDEKDLTNPRDGPYLRKHEEVNKVYFFKAKDSRDAYIQMAERVDARNPRSDIRTTLGTYISDELDYLLKTNESGQRVILNKINNLLISLGKSYTVYRQKKWQEYIDDDEDEEEQIEKKYKKVVDSWNLDFVDSENWREYLTLETSVISQYSDEIPSNQIGSFIRVVDLISKIIDKNLRSRTDYRVIQPFDLNYEVAMFRSLPKRITEVFPG